MLESLSCIKRCEATYVMLIIMLKNKDTIDLHINMGNRSFNENTIVENYLIFRIDNILIILGKGIYFT